MLYTCAAGQIHSHDGCSRVRASDALLLCVSVYYAYDTLTQRHTNSYTGYYTRIVQYNIKYTVAAAMAAAVVVVERRLPWPSIH